MMLPQTQECDCGQVFCINYSKPCSKCKSHFCEDCMKKDTCKHCEKELTESTL